MKSLLISLILATVVSFSVMATKRVENCPCHKAQKSGEVFTYQQRFNRIGVEDFRSVKKELKSSGIKGDKLDKSLGALLRMIFVQSNSSEPYKMESSMENYLLERVKLTPNQISTLEKVSKNLTERYGITKLSWGSPKASLEVHKLEKTAA